MPDVLAEIRDVAGADAAARIAETKGGRSVHFPAKAGPRHWLTLAVGAEAAVKLCAHFRVRHASGITLKIPLGEAAIYARAKRRALQLRSEGHSASETARLVGVSTRTVEKWTAAARAGSAAARSERDRNG